MPASIADENRDLSTVKPTEGLLYGQPAARPVAAWWSLWRSRPQETPGPVSRPGLHRRFPQDPAGPKIVGLVPPHRRSRLPSRCSNSSTNLPTGGTGRDATAAEASRETTHGAERQRNERHFRVQSSSASETAFSEAQTGKSAERRVSLSPHLAAILPRDEEKQARKQSWLKYVPLWPPWKARYTNRSLEEKLVCVPVYVVVNRFGAPFLSPPSPALLAELQRQKREGREFSLPHQVAVAFLDGEDATAYLHELVQSNPGGPQVDARLYCLPLSTIWEQQRRVLLDSRGTSQSEDAREESRFSLQRLFFDSGEEEEEKAREREEAGKQGAQPQLLWQIAPSAKQVQNARRHSRLSGFREEAEIPLFYVDDLVVERDGDSVLPLFFSLEDLQKAWDDQREKEELEERERERQQRPRVGPGEDDVKHKEEREREKRRQRLRQKPPVKVMNLLKLLLVQAVQPNGDKVAAGRWGFVPSSASLAFLEKEKSRGVAPARLLFSPDDAGQD
ncbi:hypothetical protein NCLIV_014390 [Neospora caninum Liverpool]|uniref:Tic22-like family protein n=1 Tax=Neospora caninum (strain Liverpool) TaxID=572307 RepID=F0VDD0_NEOCL|nr:hypothetical protein NCLIV_014390 [Neospora caninum Liverpool]CBZ51645.1 hypothetical protein NCLIV_014390 [Neospora caninum Liverpool]|eukprot:XP_003881678.1 hypothetical protein NCLIV_014390 [Neospora caninum Liverpool]